MQPSGRERHRKHFAAIRKFNEWEKSHPLQLTAQEAFSCIGTIYELMPSESKKRPLDVSGIIKMRNALLYLKVDA